MVRTSQLARAERAGERRGRWLATVACTAALALASCTTTPPPEGSALPPATQAPPAGTAAAATGTETGSPGVTSVPPTTPGPDAAPPIPARAKGPTTAADTPAAAVNRRLIPGRHVPSALAHAARPAKIPAGIYACKVDDMYRLRTCRVEVDPEDGGRTWLEVDSGNLLGMRGVLEDDHGVLVFEGFPTEEQPFGCYSCHQECPAARPGCACTEAQALGEQTCLQQPLRIRFTGGIGAYRGKMTHDTYFQTVNDDAERSPNAFAVSVNHYNVTLGRKLPPTTPRSGE
jgi:hypothetical protein